MIIAKIVVVILNVQDILPSNVAKHVNTCTNSVALQMSLNTGWECNELSRLWTLANDWTNAMVSRLGVRLSNMQTPGQNKSERWHRWVKEQNHARNATLTIQVIAQLMVAKILTTVHATDVKLPGIGEIIQTKVGIRPKAMQSLHSRVQSHQPQIPM